VYLQDRVNGFKAGCLKSRLATWKNYTTDQEILTTVSGLKVEFVKYNTTLPRSITYPTARKLTDNISNEIVKLENKGVVVQSSHEIGEVISPIFLREKSDGTHRLILNLKQLNKSVEYKHFKMETIYSVIKLIRKNAYMIKIDIKDAYYSIPIDVCDQKYFKFEHKGNLYKYAVLPNGYSPGPRKFTKILKVPLSLLRKEKIILAAYIDDLISFSNSYNECTLNMGRILEVFDDFGFIVHPEKSVFLPQQSMEYLGFILNTVDMTIQLTKAKKDNISTLCQKYLTVDTVSIRSVARLLGKMTSSFPGVQYGKLNYRALEREKIKALRVNKGNFEAGMELSAEARNNVQWWLDNIQHSCCSLISTNPNVVLTTDASKSGWGAVFGKTKTGGLFTTDETNLHINVLELKAVYFGLSSLCKEVKNMHIKLLIDNTTAVQTINNMGSCKSESCNNIVLEIWNWAICRNNNLTATHIPGILNTEADLLSRKKDTKMEWKLQEFVFVQVCKYFGFEPNVDLFASRTNKQVEAYMAFRPDPGAIAINAFTTDWKNKKFYAFPPFVCIGQVLKKVVEDEATGIIIAPDWPNQMWYPALLNMCIKLPMKIASRKDLLYLPSDRTAQHVIWDRLPLLACLVSGDH